MCVGLAAIKAGKDKLGEACVYLASEQPLERHPIM